VALPLVGLSIASSVNVGVDDWKTSVRNYMYYGLIGLLGTFAVISSPGLQYFFEQLNDGIMKNVFNGTLLSDGDEYNKGFALGLNVMVAFHTLYTRLQKPIYDFSFKHFKPE
jgi:hypothetical protein